MKNPDMRVYIAFLMGEGDNTVVINAKRLMGKRGVDAGELHEVRVEAELSADVLEPQVIGVTVVTADLSKLKLALAQLTCHSELILLGHGGKRLFAGFDGETLYKTLKDWGFKASCRVNVVSCKSAGEVAPADVETILSANYVSWARDFHRKLLDGGQHCELMARIGSTWVASDGRKSTGVKSTDPNIPTVRNHHDPRGKVRFFCFTNGGSTVTQKVEFAHYPDPV